MLRTLICVKINSKRGLLVAITNHPFSHSRGGGLPPRQLFFSYPSNFFPLVVLHPPYPQLTKDKEEKEFQSPVVGSQNS